VGPGFFDPEAKAHKDLMAALYPKKQVPFNINQQRAKILDNSRSGQLDVPGKYQSSLVNLITDKFTRSRLVSPR
jgi:hypothetical protein